MNIQKTKQLMLREKEELLLKYQVTEEYLLDRVREEDTAKREELVIVQDNIKELKHIIDFLKK